MRSVFVDSANVLLVLVGEVNLAVGLLEGPLKDSILYGRLLLLALQSFTISVS